MVVAPKLIATAASIKCAGTVMETINRTNMTRQEKKQNKSATKSKAQMLFTALCWAYLLHSCWYGAHLATYLPYSRTTLLG